MKFSSFLMALLCGVMLIMTTACHTRREMTRHESRDVKKPGVASKRLRSEVDAWIGTPYRYGGCTKSGTDCSGFVQAVYESVYGIKLPRTSQAMYTSTEAVILEQLKTGDLVFFDYEGKGVSHVGICLDEKYFAHASTSKGVVISELRSAWHLKRFVRGGRISPNKKRA